MSMKNSNDTIGNRTRDVPACSAVPQATALRRAPMNGEERKEIHHKYIRRKNLWPVSPCPPQILHGLPLQPRSSVHWSPELFESHQHFQCPIALSFRVIPVAQLFINFPLLLRSPLMYVNLLTTVHHGSYTYKRNAHYFQPFYFTFILKLYLRSRLANCLFPSGFLK
jgi:hypothetical protein